MTLSTGPSFPKTADAGNLPPHTRQQIFMGHLSRGSQLCLVGIAHHILPAAAVAVALHAPWCRCIGLGAQLQRGRAARQRGALDLPLARAQRLATRALLLLLLLRCSRGCERGARAWTTALGPTLVTQQRRVLVAPPVAVAGTAHAAHAAGHAGAAACAQLLLLLLQPFAVVSTCALGRVHRCSHCLCEAACGDLAGGRLLLLCCGSILLHALQRGFEAACRGGLRVRKGGP